MCSQNLEDQDQNATCQNVILELIIKINKVLDVYFEHGPFD